MTLLILCSFSAIAAMVVLIATKYHWTRVPLGSLVLYALAGALATLPAGLCNEFVNRETEFGIFSPDLVKSAVSFGIGAVGEEFFKMSGGLTVTLLLLGLHRDCGPAGRMLGFITTGLSFAVLENLLVYASDDVWSMVWRGLLAVPLHGTMGVIHGAAVNRAIKPGGIWALFIGFVGAATVHCTYNNVATKVDEPYSHFALAIMVFGLLVWTVIRWRRVPEFVETVPAADDDDDEDEVPAFAQPPEK